VSLIYPKASQAGYYDDTNDELIVQGEDKFKEDRLYFYFTEALYKRNNGDSYIHLAGEANLPDGIIVHLFLKRYSHIIASAATEIKDNAFSYELGPFSEEFYPGIYGAEATVVAYLQDEKIMVSIPQDWIKRERTIFTRVQIGSLRQIVEAQELDIEEISSVVDELKLLYEKLVREYQEQKTRYNRVQWLKWSNVWTERMDTLNSKNSHRNDGKVVALFPDTEERLRMTIRLVYDLQKMIYYKFEGRDTKEVAFITIKEAIKITPEILKETKLNLIMDILPEYEEGNEYIDQNDLNGNDLLIDNFYLK
jgi:molybdopterin converting factor small subunit